MRITEAELLEALATASTAPEDARTAQEMAEAAGIDVRRVWKALKALQAQGRLVTHRVARPALGGRTMLVPGYTIAPAA
jgi:hypothetical protein